MNIQRILVPYNGTKHAGAALEAALDIAVHYQAEILVVYVIPIGTVSMRPNQGVIGEGGLTSPAVPTRQTTAKDLSRGAEIIDKAKVLCQNTKVKVSFEVRQGSRTDEFLKIAQSGIDLIIMGVRSTMKVQKVIFGNVVTTLLNEAPCSLFIIRGQEEATE